MPETTIALPSPGELEVLSNVMTYASSEFEDVLLSPLKALDEQQRIEAHIAFELHDAGRDESVDETPPLTNAKAGRLFRVVFGALETAKHLRADAESALTLLYALSTRAGPANDEEYRNYRANMHAWFEERAGVYGPEKGEGDDA